MQPATVAAQAAPNRFVQDTLPAIAPTKAFLASAVLPGAGQYLLGRERWVPYLAVEGWSFLRWLSRSARGRDLQRDYREVAWAVARRVSVGERRDSVFEYYETLANWDASGAFDADPLRGGLQPERDTTTYNGNIWALARGLYSPGGAEPQPGSQAEASAIEYYRSHAVPDSYLWAWGASRLEQQAYRTLIMDSDEAFREATFYLGVILANHVVSAIDALVTARGPLDEEGVRLRLRSGLLPASGDMRWHASVQIYW
jgi:hypothetical protein